MQPCQYINEQICSNKTLFINTTMGWTGHPYLNYQSKKECYVVGAAYLLPAAQT